MMEAPPPPSELWHGNLFDLLKWAVAPFSAMGGWAMVRWTYDRYWLRKYHNDSEAATKANEREKVIASLDIRSAGYMDRLERSEARLIAELDALRDDAKQDLAGALLERDVIYIVLQEQEEQAYAQREAHISTIIRLNALVVFFQRLADGHLSEDEIAEARETGPENEPPRLTDVRLQIRQKTLAMKGAK